MAEGTTLTDAEEQEIRARDRVWARANPVVRLGKHRSNASRAAEDRRKLLQALDASRATVQVLHDEIRRLKGEPIPQGAAFWSREGFANGIEKHHGFDALSVMDDLQGDEP